MTTDTLRYYNNNASSLSKRYDNAEVGSIWKEIGEAFCSGQKILEIGCGSGRDASYMYEIGLDVFAIDGSIGLIERALIEHPELSGRLCQTILPSVLPFSDSIFDGIVSIACLMHFRPNHIKDILSEMCRVTKKNALLIISIPAGRADVSDGKDAKGRTFTILTVEEWKNLFLDFNIEIIDKQIQPDGLGRKGIEWANFTLKRA